VLVGGRRIRDVDHRRGLEGVVPRDVFGRRLPLDDLTVAVRLRDRKDDVPRLRVGPSDTVNSWNCPGAIAAPSAASKAMLTGAFVMVLPDTVTGFGRSAVSTVAVHPGIGRYETLVSGVSCGKWTTSFVVLAVADSFGARKVM